MTAASRSTLLAFAKRVAANEQAPTALRSEAQLLVDQERAAVRRRVYAMRDRRRAAGLPIKSRQIVDKSAI